MKEPKTTFHKVNPFTGEPVTKRKGVNVEGLKIADDPFTGQRGRYASKYDALFAQMKPGQCIVCEPAETSGIKAALGQWLKKTGKEGYTRANSQYQADGRGRVWWLIAQ